MIIEYNYMVLTKIENMYYRTLHLCACLSKDELQPTKTYLCKYRAQIKQNMEGDKSTTPQKKLKKNVKKIGGVGSIPKSDFIWSGVVLPNPKIFINHLRTYKKLHCKGEPYQFNG